MTSPPADRSPRVSQQPSAAALVRAMRRTADMSQRQLAAASGVALSTVSRIESGAGESTVGTLVRFADATGCRLVVHDRDGSPLEDAFGPGVDRAGRSYPAHLDVRPTGAFGGWWGDWLYLSTLAEKAWHLSPRRRPERTFDLDRDRRDQRREPPPHEPTD